MYGKVKLSKRQIKEDKFMAFVLNTKQQFMENWQFYVIGIIVVILAVIAVIYYNNSRQAKAQQAAQQFSQALSDYRSGKTQVAIMSFTQILDDYPSDIVAEEATFLLGNINLKSKNYPEAIRYYEMYLKKYKKNKLNRAASLAGIASCYENQTKYTDAAQKFIAAYNEYPDGPLVGDYQISAMRNYLLAGDIEQAKQNLKIIEDKFKGTDLEKRAVRLFTEKSLLQNQNQG